MKVERLSVGMEGLIYPTTIRARDCRYFDEEFIFRAITAFKQATNNDNVSGEPRAYCDVRAQKIGLLLQNQDREWFFVY